MAQVNLSGFDEINDLFDQLKVVPFEVTSKALTSMANIAASKVKQSGQAMGIYDEESNVHILEKIKVGKPKKTDSGGKVAIDFSGSRSRGKTKSENTYIAFVQEYGKRNQPARPFIATAMTQNEKTIEDAGIAVFDSWFDNLK